MITSTKEGRANLTLSHKFSDNASQRSNAERKTPPQCSNVTGASTFTEAGIRIFVDPLQLRKSLKCDQLE
jgi:hypothetical protein